MNPQDIEPTDSYHLSDEDKKNIESLVLKIEKARDELDHIMVIGLDELLKLLSDKEQEQLIRVFSINPESYGFKKPQLGMERVPVDFKKVEPQAYIFNKESRSTVMQYVPAHSYEAYKLMADAMKKKIGRNLLIESCYRSNAYQAAKFLSVLILNEYDVVKTVERVAIPGYSEHGTPSKLAFDFKNEDGLPSYENPQDFKDTVEFEWLTRNGYKYDFYLTYPEDNTYGVMFEPWHWRHVPPK